MRPIDLPPADLETVRRILRDHAPGLEARAFGSRVSWTARETSDLDLVLMTESPLDAGRLAALRAALAGSNLPFRVDVADWAAVSKDFRAIIEREYAVISPTATRPTRRRWKRIVLGDCIELNDDTYSPRERWPFVNYLDTGSITENRISKIQHLVDGRDKIPARARRKARQGDIVYSTVRPNQRHYGVLRDIPENFLASTGFSVLRGRKGVAFTDFIYWFLAWNETVEYLQSVAEQSKAAYPAINPIDIERLPIDLPPLAEQRAIADVLGALDDKIELNRRMNETLEAMARAIFDDWFIDFGPTRARMEGREPYLAPEVWRLFPDRLVDTEFGQTPRGWNSTAFGDVANMTSGRSYKSSELAKSEAALVTLKSFSRDGGYRPDGLKPYIGKFKNDQIIRQGEVVVACTDITQAADVVGRPAVVHSSSIYKTLIASLDMVIVRPDREIGRAFLYFLCKSHAFTQHCLAYTTGTTVLHLDKKAVPIFKFACPPSSLLEKFGEIAEDAIDRIIANSVESESLVMLRDLLLPQLMSGQVQASNTEKAAA